MLHLVLAQRARVAGRTVAHCEQHAPARSRARRAKPRERHGKARGTDSALPCTERTAAADTLLALLSDKAPLVGVNCGAAEAKSYAIPTRLCLAQFSVVCPVRRSRRGLLASRRKAAR